MNLRKSIFAAFACFFLVGAAAPVFAQGPSSRRTFRKRARRIKRLSPIQLKLRSAVRRYVAKTVKENFGFYPIDDKEFDDSWMAKLTKVDMNRVRRVFEDEYILRGIFTEIPMETEVYETKGPEEKIEGDAPKKSPNLPTFEVDYNVVRGKSGRWRVTESALYKIGETRLFTYSEKHDRITLERDKTVTVFSFSEEEEGSSAGEEEESFEDPFAADPADENQEGPSEVIQPGPDGFPDGDPPGTLKYEE